MTNGPLSDPERADVATLRRLLVRGGEGEESLSAVGVSGPTTPAIFVVLVVVLRWSGSNVTEPASTSTLLAPRGDSTQPHDRSFRRRQARSGPTVA
jgi:hypothetical protein